METLCAVRTSSSVFGQGCVILQLMLGVSLLSSSLCQESSKILVESSFTDSFTQHQQTSVVAVVVLVSESDTQLLSSDFFATESDKGSLSLSTEGLEASEFLWSSFEAFPTSTAVVFADHSASLESGVKVSSRFVGDTSTTGTPIAESVQLPPLSTLETTVFLDSVAISGPWDPAEAVTLSAFTTNLLPSLTVPGLTAASASVQDKDKSDSTFVLESTPTPWHIPETGKPNVTLVGEALIVELTTSGLPMSVLTSPGTAMFSSNSTQPPRLPSSQGPETTSSEPWGSSTTGGNSSCLEKDSGCVEFRGEEDESRDLRTKVIVGVTCAVVVLFILAGLLFGCMRRQRGKMSSGSKIDLSSYWDDSVTLSYINGHIEIPRDSTDEMVSLDNDSFLNSLDSMSFTNTWNSDSSKRTNF